MKAIKYSALVLVFGLASLGNAIAQNVEQIYMKSGSVVEGYIAEQKPGKYITIQATKATIVVNGDSLKNRITERVPLEYLPKEWKVWAEENGKYQEIDGIRQLELSTLEFDNSRYSNVYLLERGSIITFLDLAPNQYKFVWGEMYRTVKHKRPANLFSGVQEVLVLEDNSRVVGQIIEQFPGKDLKFRTENGEVLSYKFSQIKQINTSKLTEQMGLWSQIQLLDRITVKGEDSALTGFISSRTLGKELLFEFEDGSKRVIKQNLVTSYAKIPNDRYKEVYDKVLQDGEILLNGEPAFFVSLRERESFLLLGEIVSSQMVVGETACLEARLADRNSPVTLVKAHIENVPYQNGKKTELRPWPVITYQDLIQSHVSVHREITPLGNVKISFEVSEVGDYVLHIQGRNDYIVINVIEKSNNQ